MGSKDGPGSLYAIKDWLHGHSNSNATTSADAPPYIAIPSCSARGGLDGGWPALGEATQ